MVIFQLVLFINWDLCGILTLLYQLVFEDRSFTFIIKSPPSSILLKRAASLAKASGISGKETIGKVTKKQVEEIAKLKLPDLNTANMAQAIKIIEGTARSMGIVIEG